MEMIVDVLKQLSREASGGMVPTGRLAKYAEGMMRLQADRPLGGASEAAEYLGMGPRTLRALKAQSVQHGRFRARSLMAQWWVWVGDDALVEDYAGCRASLTALLAEYARRCRAMEPDRIVLARAARCCVDIALERPVAVGQAAKIWDVSRSVAMKRYQAHRARVYRFCGPGSKKGRGTLRMSLGAVVSCGHSPRAFLDGGV